MRICYWVLDDSSTGRLDRSGFSAHTVLQIGFQGIDAEDRLRADIMWHFTKLVRLLSTQDYVLFQTLYRLAYEMEVELDIRRLLESCRTSQSATFGRATRRRLYGGRATRTRRGRICEGKG